MDADWWQLYIEEARRDFVGERFSVNSLNPKLLVTRTPEGFKTFGNSGAAAISMAVLAGAKKIILLGYDCQHTDGQRHWHGNHPKGLGNADVIAKWPKQFSNLAATLDGVDVVNCTRKTGLGAFRLGRLEEELEST